MISLQVRKTQTNIEKIVGLIGEKQPYPLFIQTRFGIHTFGVRFPIDVLILDKNYVVRVQKKPMEPNRVLLWNPRYPYVLELPKGTITAKKIKKGEKIQLVIK